MAAAAEPSGHLSACDIHPGQYADDPLYPPLMQRVRGIMGRRGVLDAGDGKMAARAPRAESAAHHDCSLVPLPLTGGTATQVETWSTAIGAGAQEATRLWDGSRWLGAGYECERPRHAVVDGEPVCWTERVQVVRAPTLAQRQQASLEKRLAAAEAERRALTPAPGRGTRQRRDGDPVPAAIPGGLARHDVAGLLTPTWERHATTVTRYGGRGRGGPARPPRIENRGRYALTGVQRHEEGMAARRHRLGWRGQGTNAPVDRLPLPQAVRHSRSGWSLERDFHLVQDLPLGLSPLCVWESEPITGLTRLLPLALRLLPRRETPVRRGLEQTHEPVAGLSEGSPTRTTERPTGTRLLPAFARAQITLTHVRLGRSTCWYLTPLSPLPEQLLRHLCLPTSLYTALVYNSSEAI